MKNLLLLVFIFSVNGLFAQEFNSKIIAKNKVEKISAFTPVPNTNPEYYNEPKGFMHVSDSYFNELGQETKYVCFQCSRASHTKPEDLIITYTYKKGKLVKVRQTGIDTTNVSYLYYPDRFRNLMFTTNDKNERIGLKLVYTDKAGRELKSYELSMQYVTPENNNVHININMSSYINRKRRDFIKANEYSISMNQLKILRLSNNLAQLEACLKQIEKQLITDWMPPIMKFQPYCLYFYDAKGNIAKTITNPEGDFEGKSKEVYYYNEDGLLVKSTSSSAEFTSWRKYRYVFRK